MKGLIRPIISKTLLQLRRALLVQVPQEDLELNTRLRIEEEYWKFPSELTLILQRDDANASESLLHERVVSMFYNGGHFGVFRRCWMQRDAEVVEEFLIQPSRIIVESVSEFQTENLSEALQHCSNVFLDKRKHYDQNLESIRQRSQQLILEKKYSSSFRQQCIEYWNSVDESSAILAK